MTATVVVLLAGLLLLGWWQHGRLAELWKAAAGQVTVKGA